MNNNYSNEIQFYLNGELIIETDFHPQTTVLNYLREQQKLKGSKEGCAEGDCGACTAVIISLDKTKDTDALQYSAVNTCIQLLATLDGKHIVTVEALQRDGILHPIQQSLIENHGSQCGFCTPGFIMSLFAMYHSPQPNARSSQEICDVLAGNLCRCTGYGPILESAAQIEALRHRNITDQFDALHNQLIEQLQHSKPKKTLLLSSKDGDNSTQLYKPVSEQQLQNLLTEYPKATIISGATDVGLWITKQFRELPTLIYLGEITSLSKPIETDTSITLPANITYQQALPFFDKNYPNLANLIRRIGSTQVRNVGTLCGNIANGSPIGDMPPALMVLGSSIILKSARGERRIALADFFIHYGQQDRQADEYVFAIEIPKPKKTTTEQQFFIAHKVSKRFDQDITAVLMAVNITIDQSSDSANILDCQIAFGGMAGTPQYAHKAMKILNNSPITEQNFALAADSLCQDFSPMSDQRASASYRLLCAQNLVRKIYWSITDPDSLIEVDKVSAFNIDNTKTISNAEVIL